MTSRRQFITLLGGAAVTWPIATGAQQLAMSVIGFLASVPQNEEQMQGFRQGLKQVGFVEGENVAILYRSAENEIDRLPALADDLSRRRVAVITTSGQPAAFAAKAATATIPILFIAAEDPVRLGLVANLARPGSNLTGVNIFASEVVSKRLALLRELVPAASRVAVLVDPANKTITCKWKSFADCGTAGTNSFGWSISTSAMGGRRSSVTSNGRIGEVACVFVCLLEPRDQRMIALSKDMMFSLMERTRERVH
jgi:ABC-type uncharacterized transport system substrate-binding protein